jgi:hypothetical protein
MVQKSKNVLYKFCPEYVIPSAWLRTGLSVVFGAKNPYSLGYFLVQRDASEDLSMT